jgi:hypothetical protein
MRAPLPTTWLVVLGAIASASCIDPVRSDNVAALGPEAPGVPVGERHRPNQPCLTCHGGDGPGSPEFAIGGTINALRGKVGPAAKVTVVLTDANGATKTKTSNDVGNFYIETREWAPAYPVRVELQSGSTSKVMKTLIGGSGSCAACHYGADNAPDHMPPVFLRSQ